MDELQITALEVDDLRRLLARSGSNRVSKNVILKHIEQGAPQNADGTMNLIEYMAWMIKELSQ